MGTNGILLWHISSYSVMKYDQVSGLSPLSGPPVEGERRSPFVQCVFLGRVSFFRSFLSRRTSFPRAFETDTCCSGFPPSSPRSNFHLLHMTAKREEACISSKNTDEDVCLCVRRIRLDLLKRTACRLHS